MSNSLQSRLQFAFLYLVASGCERDLSAPVVVKGEQAFQFVFLYLVAFGCERDLSAPVVVFSHYSMPRQKKKPRGKSQERLLSLHSCLVLAGFARSCLALSPLRGEMTFITRCPGREKANAKKAKSACYAGYISNEENEEIN